MSSHLFKKKNQPFNSISIWLTDPKTIFLRYNCHYHDLHTNPKEKYKKKNSSLSQSRSARTWSNKSSATIFTIRASVGWSLKNIHVWNRAISIGQIFRPFFPTRGWPFIAGQLMYHNNGPNLPMSAASAIAHRNMCDRLLDTDI